MKLCRDREPADRGDLERLVIAMFAVVFVLRYCVTQRRWGIYRDGICFLWC